MLTRREASEAYLEKVADDLIPWANAYRHRAFVLRITSLSGVVTLRASIAFAGER